jgi:hypothetical protein
LVAADRTAKRGIAANTLTQKNALILNESVTARVSTLTALLVPLLAFAQHAPPAQPFQRLDDCAYKPQRCVGEHVKILSLSDELLLDKRQEDRGLAVRVVEHLESDLQIF